MSIRSLTSCSVAGASTPPSVIACKAITGGIGLAGRLWEIAFNPITEAITAAPAASAARGPQRANAAATAMPPASTTASSTVSPPNPPSRTSPLLRHTL